MISSTLLQQSWRTWMSHDVEPVGPRWLQYGWTVLFSMLVAVAFTVVGFLLFAGGEGAWRNLAGWAAWYFNYLVVSLCIGLAIHALFDAGKRWVGRGRIRSFRPWQRSLYFSVVPLVGVAIGWPLGMAALGLNPGRWRGTGDANTAAGLVLFSLLMMLLFITYFSIRHRQLSAERRATEAQLKLLQGQIEPHFLFNTLANVLSLMESDSPRARQMLESFVDYLRSSLGSLRIEGHTLGAELELVEAYLRIVKIRMDDRLSYRIDVPAALRALPLPALTLQPLVENAVVHGLEPKIEGGCIVISALLEAGALVLQVEDDGLGLQAARPGARGNGTALDNIRERLLQTHGGRAGLQLGAGAGQGARAVLHLPLPH